MNNKYSTKGKLQVSVFANNIGKPVPNARVRILEGNTTNIIEELYTDNSGQTESIDLFCPPKEFSLDPENNILPYAEYDMEVVSDSFQTTRIDGVQILNEVESIQDVNLNTQISTENQTDFIAINPHTLWASYPPKIEEDELKLLNPGNGFIVLSQPIIPEYIVVHGGVPTNASAPNHYILFKEYIKNVASGEIYSTWPDATIRANVLAIVSFTLNRVYTEWYRNKGYNFTITSSTTVDHAFVNGRNIFKEISQIVDEIFTTYVARPNARQPLFTQYCDGKKSSCPKWMSQWGSKTLGDQGYSALNILKNYYGYDIYLTQATKVTGVPSSFKNSLRVGSSGTDIRTMQEQLNAVSNNYPAIAKMKADGIFGELTKQSVQTFQKIFKLTSDGIVGFATWYKISEIYVAVMKLSD